MARTFRPKKRTVLNFPKVAELQCQPNRGICRYSLLTDRQMRLTWWDQKTINFSKVLMVGQGGLNSNLSKIFIQMGVGVIHGIDPDLVEYSNLNRQLFLATDVGKPKSLQLLKNLRPYAVRSTRLRGYFMPFEEWIETHKRAQYDVACCGVDSISTMYAVSNYCGITNTTGIFTNVSEDGEACRVFIQRPGAACFACYMPQTLTATPERRGCAPVPAIADILHVAVGFGARATVAELLGAPMGDYNCRDITFGGFDVKKNVARLPNCPLCRKDERP